MSSRLLSSSGLCLWTSWTYFNRCPVPFAAACFLALPLPFFSPASCLPHQVLAYVRTRSLRCIDHTVIVSSDSTALGMVVTVAGGAGCDVMEPGKRCPGMTSVECESTAMHFVEIRMSKCRNQNVRVLYLV